MKPIILRRWTEVEEEMLTDRNHKPRTVHYLFVWNVEIHKGPQSGKITEHRRKSLITLEGRNGAEADQKLADFVSQKNVKLLPPMSVTKQRG